jgi:hypothetical protein
MKFSTFRWQVFALLAALSGTGNLVALAGQPIFVSHAATGASDGSSWANAFRDLQDALDDAIAGEEIWVASGVYKPDVGTDRLATFLLRNGVAVYGGFAGTETQRSERSWQAHVTILSGDINNSGDSNGNAYHVVTGNGTDNSTILDGFFIQGGYATGSNPHNLGGGVYNSNGSPTLSNLVIAGNRASIGGGMYNSNSSPALTNISFVGNRASTFGGGLANEAGSNPVLNNVSFSGNHAGSAGGGMDNFNDSNPIIRNSLFWGNEAFDFEGTSHSISNAFSTPTIGHSLLQDCKPAGSWNSDCGLEIDDSNLADADPLFLDMPNPGDAPSMAGDLRLRAGSPALNSGNNEFVDISMDLAGNARIVNEFVDLGAYERPSDSCPASGILHVGQGGQEPGDGVGWASAFDDLQDALIVVDNCEIWVASGTYRPTDGTRREAAFALKNDVGVYGGFDGTETQRNQRNWQANPTLLSGDINQFGTSIDNAFHVVTASGTDSSAVLDGFSIIEGNASGEPATPCDQRCGGGIFISGGSPILRNIRLIGNQATAWGGGLYNFSSSSPELINVQVSGNRAGWGGGIYNHLNSHPELTNIAFSGNFASVGIGGGLRNFDNSNPAVRNTIFWNNRDTNGAGTPSASVANNNSLPLVSYSLVQGCNPEGIWNSDCGTYAIINLPDDDPLFVFAPSPDDAPTTDGNMRLRPGSPVIDAGNDAYLEGLDVVRDLAANPRKNGAAVDLGPYEYFPLSDMLFKDRFEVQLP